MQKYTGKTGYYTAGNGEKHGHIPGYSQWAGEGMSGRGIYCRGRNGKEKYLILLEKGKELLKPYKVDGALIIAAGFGSRFVPLTFETPKGLLEVFGERMIERQIKQLHEVGIHDITIAVGYLKEKFEYLIDKYDVKLLYNPEYSCKTRWLLYTEPESS